MLRRVGLFMPLAVTGLTDQSSAVCTVTLSLPTTCHSSFIWFNKGAEPSTDVTGSFLKVGPGFGLDSTGIDGLTGILVNGERSTRGNLHKAGRGQVTNLTTLPTH